MQQCQPSASQAPAAAASAAALPNTLVLGMAFITDEYSKLCEANERSGTTSSNVRDRRRLLKLEQLEGHTHKVISLNKDTEEKHCQPNSHVQVSIGRRAVQSLQEKLQSKALSFVFGDYFRCPSEYLVQLFSPFLKEMIPEMIEKGIVNEDTDVILPWPQNGELNAALASLHKKCSQKEWLLKGDLIPSEQYPLYQATDGLDEVALGGYKNSTELVSLVASSPFLRLRWTKSKQESEKSLKAVLDRSSQNKASSSAVFPAAATIDKNGWHFFKATPSMQQIALQWENYASIDSPDAMWAEQRGPFYQLDLHDSRAQCPFELLEASEAAGRRLLRSALGVVAEQSLKLGQEKLLSFPQSKKFVQEPHCDANTLQMGEQCYSVLFYITAGESTAVPFAAFDQEMERQCWKDSIAKLEKRKAIPLSSFPVDAGSALVLSQKVLHRAPANCTGDNRLVLFQQWIPFVLKKRPDSDLQRLPLGFKPEE